MTRRPKPTPKQAERIARQRRHFQSYLGRYGPTCLCMLAAEKIERLERTIRVLKRRHAEAIAQCEPNNS